MSNQQNPKILVVDDLVDMRMVLGLTLKRNGWDVLEAEDGVQAVEMTRQERPDVILMDYNMPQMNGIEACHAIKNDHALQHIPVLIYTGAYATDVKEAAFAAGADQFLTKPILPADLRAEVKAAYERAQQAYT